MFSPGARPIVIRNGSMANPTWYCCPAALTVMSVAKFDSLEDQSGAIRRLIVNMFRRLVADADHILRTARRISGPVVVMAFVVSAIGCSQDSFGSDDASPTTNAEVAGDDGTAAEALAVEEPWSFPVQSDLDLAKSVGKVSVEPCAVEPPPPATPGAITLIRLVDGCPVFEVSDADADLAVIRAQPDVVAADVVQSAQELTIECSAEHVTGGDKAPWSHAKYLKGIERPGSMATTPVAIIDSGMDVGHTDLEDALYEPSVPVSSHPDETGECKHGHGTHVAGIIAAADDDAGSIGVAPGTKILPFYVNFANSLVAPVVAAAGGDAGGGTWVAPALVAAADSGVRVINMSFSLGDEHGHTGSTPNEAVEWAVRYALARDVVLIASAGNCGNPADHNLEQCENEKNRNVVEFPAAYDGVVGVAAIDSQGKRVSWSTANESVDIAAPGLDIVSSMAGTVDGAISMDGTSMAAPFVTGVVALMRAKNPDKNRNEVEKALLNSASARPSGGRKVEYGVGIINPVAAVKAIPGLIGPWPAPLVVDWRNSTFDLSPALGNCSGVATKEPLKFDDGSTSFAGSDGAVTATLEGVVPITIRRTVGLFTCSTSIGNRSTGFAAFLNRPTGPSDPVTLTGVIDVVGGEHWGFADPTFNSGDLATAHSELSLDRTSILWASAGPWTPLSDYSTLDVFSVIGDEIRVHDSLVRHASDGWPDVLAARHACESALSSIPVASVQYPSGIQLLAQTPFGLDPGRQQAVPDHSIVGVALSAPEDPRQLVKFSESGVTPLPAETDLSTWSNVAAIGLPWDPLETGNRVCVTAAAFEAAYQDSGG